MLTMNITLALFFVVVFLGITSAIEVEEDGGHHDGVHLYSWRWSHVYYSQQCCVDSTQHIFEPRPS